MILVQYDSAVIHGILGLMVIIIFITIIINIIIIIVVVVVLMEVSLSSSKLYAWVWQLSDVVFLSCCLFRNIGVRFGYYGKSDASGCHWTIACLVGC